MPLSDDCQSRTACTVIAHRLIQDCSTLYPLHLQTPSQERLVPRKSPSTPAPFSQNAYASRTTTSRRIRSAVLSSARMWACSLARSKRTSHPSHALSFQHHDDLCRPPLPRSALTAALSLHLHSPPTPARPTSTSSSPRPPPTSTRSPPSSAWHHDSHDLFPLSPTPTPTLTFQPTVDFLSPATPTLAPAFPLPSAAAVDSDAEAPSGSSQRK